uniref:Uncharacterized protein n=1 Tax=Pipistrellus kuhlii TaxID=59472 RepID=A0A7J7VUY5_PIPKU|nr:hypothetical protein mPipKuh1_008251 [Pipistrellus kuhlii]
MMRENHCLADSYMPPTGDRARNPAMCPWPESNLGPREQQQALVVSHGFSGSGSRKLLGWAFWVGAFDETVVRCWLRLGSSGKLLVPGLGRFQVSAGAFVSSEARLRKELLASSRGCWQHPAPCTLLD